MESKLDIGSVVELKSGGPLLTVRMIVNDEVTVDYFSNEGYHLTSAFHRDQLR